MSNMYRPGPQYPENWNRLRHFIFKMYGYRCQNCGMYSKGNLHLHHIRPLKLGGSNHWSNLIPLCKVCHELVSSGAYRGPLLRL